MLFQQNSTNAYQLKRQTLRSMGVCQSHTWFYAAPGYELALRAFQEHPEFFQDPKTIIWQVGDRDVRKITLPEAYGGFTIAFKRYEGNKPLRYAYHASKTAIEAANFRIFSQLGIPMAPLAFVGDIRTCFYLKRSYIATIFAQDCQDGRAFSPHNAMDGTPLQQAFIREVLHYLAQLHTLHCFHRGAHVYNFLWKPLGQEKVATTWIDVASCRFLKRSEDKFTPYLIKDIADFFRDLEIPDQDFTNAMDAYRSQNPKCLLDTAELCRQVKAKVGEVRAKIKRKH